MSFPPGKKPVLHTLSMASGVKPSIVSRWSNKTVLNLNASILWKVVVPSPALQRALSPCLTASSSCWIHWRDVVEVLLQGGLWLKKSTQSFGACRLPLRQEVHGATPAQTQPPRRPPEGHVLFAPRLFPSTIHHVFSPLKPETDFDVWFGTASLLFKRQSFLMLMLPGM